MMGDDPGAGPGSGGGDGADAGAGSGAGSGSGSSDGSDSNDPTLVSAISGVITSRACTRIYFSYAGVTINNGGYAQINDAISSVPSRITVSLGDTGDPNQGALYNPGTNTMLISYSVSYQSLAFRQYCVHECAHAIQDALGVITRQVNAEAIAYLAGALYAIYNGEQDQYAAGSGIYPIALKAATSIAGATQLAVTDDIMQPLKDAILKDPSYSWYKFYVGNGLG